MKGKSLEQKTRASTSGQLRDRPRRAFILGAGFGTRLHPLTCDIPKPLIPLWGRPILDHTLDWLQGQGVSEVLINIHHSSAAFLQWAKASPRPGLHISFSFEPVILGTGGALAKARWFLEQEPFWMVNGDIVFDVDSRDLLESIPSDCRSLCWLHPDRGPRTVRIDETGCIQNFRGPLHGPGQGTLCGLHWIHPDLFEHVPKKTQFCSLVDIWEKALRAGHRIQGCLPSRSYWADLGTPQRLLQAHRDTRLAAKEQRPGGRLYRPQKWPRGVTINGFAVCCHGASARPGAQLTDSILWPGAQAGKRSRLTEAIVGRDVRVNQTFTGNLVRADRLLPEEVCHKLESLGWNLPHTSAEFLGARGSDRSFTRLRCGRRKGLMVQYSEAREENMHYAAATRFLQAHGLHVPALLMEDLPTRHLLFEDLGTRCLQAFSAHSLHRRNAYEQAIHQLALLHGLAEPAQQHLKLMPPFNRTLYHWEHELFCTHYLANRPLTAARRAALKHEFSRLTRLLNKVEKDLLHRDYQSSNLMWHRQTIRMIDYQGMRLGPATYDLASLLCDPYSTPDPGLREELLALYVTLRPERKELVEATFWPAAIQRLLQALGAFARLSKLPGQAHFARHTAPARTQCLEAIHRVSGFPVLRELLLSDT